MADDTKFVVWLLLLSGSSACFGSDLDVQCLKTVQQSVIDPNGILKSTWMFDDTGGGFICGFTGVECWHPNENRVLNLRLNNLGLEGQFPQGLENCTSMTGLDLSSNNFSGPMPSDITRQLPSLTSLDLSYNSFSGEIPVGISNLTYLNTLNLQHNQLNGHVPGEFSALHRLEVFSVADNQLSGPIPSPLTEFPASSFAGDQGICGAPLLTECGRKSKRRLKLQMINKDSSIFFQKRDFARAPLSGNQRVYNVQQRVQYWRGCRVRGRIRGGLLLPSLVRLLSEAPSLHRSHMNRFLDLKLVWHEPYIDTGKL